MTHHRDVWQQSRARNVGEVADSRDPHAVALTAPPSFMAPKRVSVRMARARRPRRVHEAVVKILLQFFGNLLGKRHRIVRPIPGRDLFSDYSRSILVLVADGCVDVISKQLNDP